MILKRKNILVFHSDLESGGGAEAYAQAVIRELRECGHNVSVLDISGMYLNDGSFQSCVWTKWVLKIPPIKNFSLLKYSMVCRRVISLADDYELVVSTYGELPKLNTPAIRVMHAPSMYSSNSELLKYIGVTGDSNFYLVARQLYSFLFRVFGKIKLKTTEEEKVVTIVNSKWTADVIEKHEGKNEYKVVYPYVKPPSIIVKDDLPNARFVSVGRIVPNKRFEEAVEIIRKLRESWPDVHLSIVGRSSSAYAKKFKVWAEQFPFVSVIENADEQELNNILEASSWGLHCYRYEHFGISVAEMCSVGIVPFVFDGGGVREIVPIEELRYKNIDDAVGKIQMALHGREKWYQYKSILMGNPVLCESFQFNKNFRDALLESMAYLERGH